MNNPIRTVRSKLAVSAISLALLAVVAGVAVFSAFSSTQTSGANTFAAGSVALTTNGTGSSLFSLSGMKPGDTATSCVQVTYTGTLAANVSLYATQSGGLAQYLTTSIVRGTFPGAAPAANACTNFTPDSGGGSLFSGTLSTLPAVGSPIADPTSPWAANDVHVYQITVTLPSNVLDAAQGLDANAALTWQSTTH